MFQFSSGMVLGRYELLIPVAQGGMADVWAARLHGTRGFTKLVAIKTIRPGALDGQRLEQMLLAEAQLAAQIVHPNVISTLELGEQNSTLFLVMEWADGEPVSVLLSASDDDPLPYPIAVNIIAQACRGVHCAHELADADGNPLGVVHRDLSPQNLLVTYTGIVKVVDFGVAKATQLSSSLTEDGELKGKLAYMSPEQVRGEAIDRRTDVFALGTILYLLTTGKHPFKCAHPAETMTRLLSDVPIVSPSRVVPGYPPELQEVVLRALHKDRQQRFESADALLQALEDAVPDARAIEHEVAKCLVERAGELGERRRKHIRTAGEQLDRSDSFVRAQSPASLSAVSVSTTSSPSSLSLPRAAEPAVPAEVETVDFKERSWRVWASAAAVLTALGVGATLSSNDASSSGSPPAAAQPIAAEAVQAPQTLPGTASLAEPALPGNATAPTTAPKSLSSASSHEPRALRDSRSSSAATEPATPESAQPASGAQARRRRSAPVASGTASAAASGLEPAPVAPAATEAAAAPGKPKRQAPKAKKKDSWDPDTFGGRL